MRVRYSPLQQQFADPEPIFEALRALVASGDFTLGSPVDAFEAAFAAKLGVKHAIGVGSGTDALKIGLRAGGVGPGDEVITTANTFWASVGAIAELGATSVFVDCDAGFCTDADLIEAAITEKTKAIMPVHLTGGAADMRKIMAIAEKHGLHVVEDACQSLMARLDGQVVGTFGACAAFSMHPLKVINVWGDAGVVVTNDDGIAETARLLRNHGLKNRDEMVMLGYNSRLDSVQAVVGSWILDQVEDIVSKRRANAAYLDRHLARMPGLALPARSDRVDHVHLLYILFAENRDGLLAHCLQHGVEAKLHYPVPVYLQPAMRFLGYREGDFPVTDRNSSSMLTLPVDQHLETADLDYMIDVIKAFCTDPDAGSSV
ncbi:MAG: DegT/DnrJ/EryC1/StrS family aminotransferase [Alphaproteobacteria bacterium]